MPDDLDGVYFHEDSYCQIEIVPGESLTWCLAQIDGIREFSRSHWSGSGWDDMFIRPAYEEKLASRGIVQGNLRAEMCPPFRVVDNVFTGYSTHREKCQNTFALNSDSGTNIFASGGNGTVEAMWLTLRNGIGSSAHVSHLVGFMGSHRLILVDWSRGAVIGPSIDEMTRYARYDSDDE